MKKQGTPGFGKKNYKLMLIGLAILIAGFVIMTLDKEPYGFGFMGITLGPIVVMIGFIFQFVAILSKSETEK
jgi:isoprenylcysteine carboxyl methyltransferase (ICMT) family protein YpbQ